MLYDFKRWEKPEIKSDPFSLESLIAWLEMQPATGAYCFNAFGHCLLAQWMKSIDPISRHSSGYRYVVDGEIKDFDINPIKGVALYKPHTFGAALERALNARTS